MKVVRLHVVRKQFLGLDRRVKEEAMSNCWVSAGLLELEFGEEILCSPDIDSSTGDSKTFK
jgi:hypothetical protein